MITLKTYDIVKQREVMAGKFNEKTRVFTKRVKDCHYMRKTQSYGIQSDVIEMLINMTCKAIHIKTEDGLYISDFGLWVTQGMAQILDFGHGEQNHLSIRHMQYTTKKRRNSQKR